MRYKNALMIGMSCLVILMHSACGQGRFDLPNGFIVVVGSTQQVFISNRETSLLVVFPHISGFYQVGGIVTGYKEDSRFDEDPYSKEGYFILNTENQKVLTGLSEQDWNSHLKKCGIDFSIKLDPLHKFRNKVSSKEYQQKLDIPLNCLN